MQAIDVPAGRYTFVSHLQSSLNAEIYRTRVDGLFGFEKLVALKKLSARGIRDEEARRRLIRHAVICSKLSHHNVVGVYDFYQDRSGLCLAMELVEGASLNTILLHQRQTGRPFPLATVLSLASQMLEVLDYIHKSRDPISRKRLGLVHRDLTPGNVLIDRAGVIKLIGFGRAQLAEDTPPLSIWDSPYAAPEIATGQPVTASADIFSLGALMYELMTLRPLLTERAHFATQVNDSSRQGKLARLEVEAWIELLPRTYQCLRPILLRAVSIAPEGRYPSAARMFEDLRPFLVPASKSLPPDKGLSQAAESALDQEVHSDPIPRKPPRDDELEAVGRPIFPHWAAAEVEDDDTEAGETQEVETQKLETQDAAGETLPIDAPSPRETAGQDHAEPPPASEPKSGANAAAAGLDTSATGDGATAAGAVASAARVTGSPMEAGGLMTGDEANDDEEIELEDAEDDIEFDEGERSVSAMDTLPADAGLDDDDSDFDDGDRSVSALETLPADAGLAAQLSAQPAQGKREYLEDERALLARVHGGKAAPVPVAKKPGSAPTHPRKGVLEGRGVPVSPAVCQDPEEWEADTERCTFETPLEAPGAPAGVTPPAAPGGAGTGKMMPAPKDRALAKAGAARTRKKDAQAPDRPGRPASQAAESPDSRIEPLPRTVNLAEASAQALPLPRTGGTVDLTHQAAHPGEGGRADRARTGDRRQGTSGRRRYDTLETPRPGAVIVSPPSGRKHEAPAEEDEEASTATIDQAAGETGTSDDQAAGRLNVSEETITRLTETSAKLPPNLLSFTRDTLDLHIPSSSGITLLFLNPHPGLKCRIPQTGLSIGRAHSNDLVLADFRVNPRHASIIWVTGRWWLRALDGTTIRVDGVDVEEAPLAPGQLIEIGGTRSTVLFEQVEERGAVVDFDALIFELVARFRQVLRDDGFRATVGIKLAKDTLEGPPARAWREALDQLRQAPDHRPLGRLLDALHKMDVSAVQIRRARQCLASLAIPAPPTLGEGRRRPSDR